MKRNGLDLAQKKLLRSLHRPLVSACPLLAPSHFSSGSARGRRRVELARASAPACRNGGAPLREGKRIQPSFPSSSGASSKRPASTSRSPPSRARARPPAPRPCSASASTGSSSSRCSRGGGRSRPPSLQLPLLGLTLFHRSCRRSPPPSSRRGRQGTRAPSSRWRSPRPSFSGGSSRRRRWL